MNQTEHLAMTLSAVNLIAYIFSSVLYYAWHTEGISLRLHQIVPGFHAYNKVRHVHTSGLYREHIIRASILHKKYNSQTGFNLQ